MQITFENFHGFGLDPVNGRWFRPPPNYLKLNINGSMKDGKVTYGGHWVWGFVGSCAYTSPLLVQGGIAGYPHKAMHAGDH